jgi:hypothetical protein
VDDKLVQLARNQLVQLAKQQQNNHKLVQLEIENYSIYIKSIKEGKGTTVANDERKQTTKQRQKVQRCGNILGEW